MVKIMQKPIKAVVYTRVSTDTQDPKGQLQVILDYADSRGYEVVKIFEEHGVSGAIDPLERPKFKEMLEFIKENNIEVILAYDLTRFYRATSPSEALQKLREIMEQYNVLFDFAREPEIEDPLLRELWLFIKSWFATYERLQISLRTKYGLAKVKREGRLYHKPSLAHYYASVLFEKDLGQVTKEEVEFAKKKLQNIVKKYWFGPYKKNQLWKVLAQAELKELYERYPYAPKTYYAFYNLMKGVKDE